MKGKPTVSVDFDGVLHSYVSGWKGARAVVDAPVPGAIEWLISMLPHFEIAISSARSSQWGGRRAMKLWLRDAAVDLFIRTRGEPWMELVSAANYDVGMDPPDHEARNFGDHVVKQLRFPRTKPSAVLYIDDRAHCFTGAFPTREEIAAFKPWNKPVTP